MVTNLGMYLDGGKCYLHEGIVPPTPVWDDRKKDFQPVTMTDDLLDSWRGNPAEIIEAEPLSGSGKFVGEGASYTMHILRCKHQDGHFSVQPIWKLFPINPNRHEILRNMQLWYIDLAEEFKKTLQLNNDLANHSIPGFRRVKFPMFNITNLQFIYCRKNDVTIEQAQSRTSNWSAEDWWDEVGERIQRKQDEDLCWLVCK